MKSNYKVIPPLLKIDYPGTHCIDASLFTFEESLSLELEK